MSNSLLSCHRINYRIFIILYFANISSYYLVNKNRIFKLRLHILFRMIKSSYNKQIAIFRFVSNVENIPIVLFVLLRNNVAKCVDLSLPSKQSAVYKAFKAGFIITKTGPGQLRRNNIFIYSYKVDCVPQFHLLTEFEI